MISSFAYYNAVFRKDFVDYCSGRLSEIGLSQGLLYFLIYVGKHPGCTPGELSKALSMDAGHTARSVGKLEQGGFLVQKQNKEDKRSRSLSLTEQGEDAFELCRNLFFLWDQQILKGLTKEEEDMLMALIKKAAGNLKKKGAGPDV